MYGISVYKVFKVVRGRVRVGGGDIMRRGVDSDIGTRVNSADLIKLGIDNAFKLDSSDYYFGVFNDGSHVGSFTDELFEWNDETLIDLYEIGIYVNAGFRIGIGRSIVRSIARGLIIDVVSEVESGDDGE